MKKFTFVVLLLGMLGAGHCLWAQAGVSGQGSTSEPGSADGSAMVSQGANSTGGNNSHLLLEDDGRIYPNPAQDGKFNVEMPTPSDRIEVFNTLGQLVTPLISYGNGGRSARVDMNGYTPGIYFVRIYTGGRTSIKRVVVR